MRFNVKAFKFVDTYKKNVNFFTIYISLAENLSSFTQLPFYEINFHQYVIISSYGYHFVILKGLYMPVDVYVHKYICDMLLFDSFFVDNI